MWLDWYPSTCLQHDYPKPAVPQTTHQEQACRARANYAHIRGFRVNVAIQFVEQQYLRHPERLPATNFAMRSVRRVEMMTDP